MLIEFSVGNYLSFNESVTFSMVAAPITSTAPSLDTNNVFQVNKELTLLKSAAIYGANASGKSNLAQAIGFMQWFVLNSSKETQIAEKINVEPFRLSTETSGKPSYFQIVFILDNIQYRYGFEVDEKQVVSEWLAHVPKSQEIMLFERKTRKFNLRKKFQKEAEGLESKTRMNALFISVVAQFNGEISQKILLWFRSNLNVISGLQDMIYRQHTLEYLDKDNYKTEIIKFIKQLDLGIYDIKIEQTKINEESLQGMPEEFKTLLLRRIKNSLQKNIKTVHLKYNKGGEMVSLEEFDIDTNESEGTKKLFAFAGPIIDALKTGKVLFIDELDARLHPMIVCEIVRLFNSKDTNFHNAQLIFTTHDTNLLRKTIFRRDQIWFTEKNRWSATDLYSLVEYKIDDDASFEIDYIRGRYGAIPFIGNLSRLVGEIHE